MDTLIVYSTVSVWKDTCCKRECKSDDLQMWRGRSFALLQTQPIHPQQAHALEYCCQPAVFNSVRDIVVKLQRAIQAVGVHVRFLRQFDVSDSIFHSLLCVMHTCTLLEPDLSHFVSHKSSCHVEETKSLFTQCLMQSFR
jgi:hypothetical protein